eukprot:scaffold302351_cov34-Prasinocladus_malaysianus.AAC.1
MVEADVAHFIDVLPTITASTPCNILICKDRIRVYNRSIDINADNITSNAVQMSTTIAAAFIAVHEGVAVVIVREVGHLVTQPVHLQVVWVPLGGPPLEAFHVHPIEAVAPYVLLALVLCGPGPEPRAPVPALQLYHPLGGVGPVCKVVHWPRAVQTPARVFDLKFFQLSFAHLQKTHRQNAYESPFIRGNVHIIISKMWKQLPGAMVSATTNAFRCKVLYIGV